MDNERLQGQEDEGYEPDLITLEDENGKEHTFEVLDTADVDEVHYLAVAPYNADPAKRLAEDAEMLIMRMGEDAGEEYLDVVDDEEELVRIGQVFLDRMRDLYDIDLDDLKS